MLLELCWQTSTYTTVSLPGTGTFSFKPKQFFWQSCCLLACCSRSPTVGQRCLLALLLWGGLLEDAGMEIQSGPRWLVLPAGDIPMSAFFRSVSASFSTTFCFWAAISSLVFSASLQGEKRYYRDTELGSSSANQGTRGQGDKKPTSCQHHVLTATRTSSVFGCTSKCVASRSKEGIIPPLYLALVRLYAV